LRLYIFGWSEGKAFPFLFILRTVAKEEPILDKFHSRRIIKDRCFSNNIGLFKMAMRFQVNA
jgi:hypothetical protein